MWNSSFRFTSCSSPFIVTSCNSLLSGLLPAILTSQGCFLKFSSFGVTSCIIFIYQGHFLYYFCLSGSLPILFLPFRVTSCPIFIFQGHFLYNFYISGSLSALFLPFRVTSCTIFVFQGHSLYYFYLTGLLPAANAGEGGGQRQVSDVSEELRAEIHLPPGHLSGN